MLNKKLALQIGSLSVVAFALIFAFVATRPMMPFPRSAHGEFIKEPEVVLNGETRSIEWTLPVYCSNASYEIREVDYEPDARMFWVGNGAACEQIEHGYHCTAPLHPDIKDAGSKWIIQTYGYDCSDGSNYVSTPIMTN